MEREEKENLLSIINFGPKQKRKTNQQASLIFFSIKNKYIYKYIHINISNQKKKFKPKYPNRCKYFGFVLASREKES